MTDTDIKLNVHHIMPIANAYNVPVETRIANGIVKVSAMTIVARDEVEACEIAMTNMSAFLGDNNGFEIHPMFADVTIIASDVLARHDIIDL